MRIAWTDGLAKAVKLAFSSSAMALTLVSLQVDAAVEPVADSDRPIALVVGNSEYEHLDGVAGEEDAEAVASALFRLGFAVVKRVNVKQLDFVDEVVAFHERSRGRPAALFYYSGFGVSGSYYSRGRMIDVLLPVDAPGDRRMLFRSLDVEDVIAGMESAVNLVFLDTPMTDGVRIRKPNTLVAYAGNMPLTEISEEGKSISSFTKALLEAIRPGADVVDVVQEVIRSLSTDDVSQLPWMESSLRAPYTLPVPGQFLAHKLDERVVTLIQGYATDGLDAMKALAAAVGVDIGDDGSVAVTILAASESHVESVKRLIKAGGGILQTTFENKIYASLPVQVIGAFARAPSVYRVDLSEAVFGPADQGAAPAGREE